MPRMMMVNTIRGRSRETDFPHWVLSCDFALFTILSFNSPQTSIALDRNLIPTKNSNWPFFGSLKSLHVFRVWFTLFISINSPVTGGRMVFVLVQAKILFSLLLWFFSLVGSNHYFVLSGLATSKTDDLVPSFTFGSFFCCCWWGWWWWWRWWWWRQYWWWGIFKRPLILFQVKGWIHGSRKVNKFWYFKSTSEIFAWNIELITNLLLIYRWYLRSINENIVGLQMGAGVGWGLSWQMSPSENQVSKRK